MNTAIKTQLASSMPNLYRRLLSTKTECERRKPAGVEGMLHFSRPFI